MGGMGGFFPPLLLVYFVTSSGLSGQDFCSCPQWPAFCGGRTQESSCRVKMSYKQNSRQPRFGPPTQFDPAHGRRCGRAFSSPPSCSVRAICRISIPRLSSTPSRSSSPPGESSFTIRSGFENRPPASIGNAGGSCSESAASFVVSLTLISLVGTHLLSQTFIARRSRLRWAMHQLIFWGCLLAAAITFPLVFGWIYFTSDPNNQMVYVTHLFGYSGRTLSSAHLHRAATVSRFGYCGLSRSRRNWPVSLAPYAR